ncbi:MAG: NADH:flavin oxidoreductase [Proteobacteria bacterium]|nr:NADH:flavin oxidoreductase [Pseudomonadota bacterium]
MSNPLFQPFQFKSLKLKNRVVMAPMTRGFSPRGIPGDDVAAYYQRRAKAEVGLIISEGTVVDRPASSVSPNYPRFHGAQALQGWQKIIDAVHAEHGKMAPQLWHQGIVKRSNPDWPAAPLEGPSGLLNATEHAGVAMDLSDIAAAQHAFVTAAATAQQLGFDAIELHGAHGYLLDQFFWSAMNQRQDLYGGSRIEDRSRFVLEIVKGIRQVVGEDFPIILRISQWKQQDYNARIAQTPAELSAWVQPLADAGVDIFHCSQRRIWEPEFADSDLNFAGWVKKLTGKPTISVGSIGLSSDFLGAFKGESSAHQGIDKVYAALDRGDFDLVAIGRALLADPDWVVKIRDERINELAGFAKESLGTLY